MRTNLRGTYGAGDVERRGGIIGAADRWLAAVGGEGLKGTGPCPCCMGSMDASCGGGDSPPFASGAVRDEACKPSKDWMILAVTGWLKADAHRVVGGLCPGTSTPPPLTHFLLSTVSTTSEVVGLSTAMRTVVPSKPCTSVNACSGSLTTVPSILSRMSSGYTRTFMRAYACEW